MPRPSRNFDFSRRKNRHDFPDLGPRLAHRSLTRDDLRETSLARQPVWVGPARHDRWRSGKGCSARRFPAGDDARAIAQGDSRPQGAEGRTGRGRAVDLFARGHRFRTGRQALGGRNVRLPLRRQRRLPAGRPRASAREHARRRQVRQVDRLSRPRPLSQRHHRLEEGGAGLRGSRHHLCRGHRRRRQGRHPQSGLHRLRFPQLAGPHEQPELRSRQLGSRRQRAARRHGSLPRQAGTRSQAGHPRLPHGSRSAPVRVGERRRHAAGTHPRRLGQLLLQSEQRAVAQHAAAGSLRQPQPVRRAARAGRDGAEGRSGPPLPDQPHAAAFQPSGEREPRHFGVQPRDLSGRFARRGVSGQRLHVRARPRSADSPRAQAAGGNVRRLPRAERAELGVLCVGRQLVAAGRRQEWSRRRAVGRRHVSHDHRAPEMDHG